MATAWSIYNLAKKKIGNGTITLGSNINRIKLHTSASNASTATLSTAASVSSEVSTGTGYSTGGQTLSSVTWTTGASASEYRFDSANPAWTASGGAIANIKFAVVKQSTGDQAIMWSRLTTAQFSLSDGNTLTLQINASGYFELN